MQVLASPPFSSTTPASSSSSSSKPAPPKPSSSSRSLLDRRQTAAAKLLHHQPSQSSLSSTSPSLLTASGTPAPFLPSPRMSLLAFASSSSSSSSSPSSSSSSSSSSYPLVATLPFVPLTPIMASPRLTPDIGAAPGSVVSVVGGGGGGGKSDERGQHHHQQHGHGHERRQEKNGSVGVGVGEQERADYLNRGRAGVSWYDGSGVGGIGMERSSIHTGGRVVGSGTGMTSGARQRFGSLGGGGGSGGISRDTGSTDGVRSTGSVTALAVAKSKSTSKSKSRRAGSRSRSRSRSRSESQTRSRSRSVSKTTNPTGSTTRTRTPSIDLSTLPPYEPLPPLSLSPDFRRLEGGVVEQSHGGSEGGYRDGHRDGVEVHVQSQSHSHSQSPTQPQSHSHSHHQPPSQPHSQPHSQPPAHAPPQPRANTSPTARVSYARVGHPPARSTSLPPCSPCSPCSPCFEPLGGRRGSGLPSSTSTSSASTSSTSTSTSSTPFSSTNPGSGAGDSGVVPRPPRIDSPSSSPSPSSSSTPHANTNANTTTTTNLDLDGHYDRDLELGRYRRVYSVSDEGLHLHLHLRGRGSTSARRRRSRSQSRSKSRSGQQHSQSQSQSQTYSQSQSHSRSETRRSREGRRRMFKRSVDSFTGRVGCATTATTATATTATSATATTTNTATAAGTFAGVLVEDEDVTDAGCVLTASLSRKGRSRSVKPKMSLKSLAVGERGAGREESVGRGRRMFIVGGDGSDVEGENEVDGDGDVDGERASENVEVLEDQEERDCREREERRTARRYHALLELLTTEVGYLQDLRALVSIHLAQLPSLDAPIPSSLSRPSPSSLSISNLGLSRPFPSSRSFLHLPPSSYAQGPGPGPPPSQDSLSPTSAVDRHRDAFDGERSRETESASLAPAPSQKESNSKPTRRFLFSEQDVQLITRNAGELLAMHETFVKMLKYALEPLGFGDAFLGGGAVEVKKRPAGVGREEVENAVKAVTELFCRQASAFEVYESFCPGHNEATDLIRTVQEHHPVEWDAFEQRCSLRVSHAFDQQGSPSMDSLRGSLKSKRRHSLSSLAMPMTLSPFGAVALTPVPLSATGPAKSDTPAHKRKGSGDVVSPSSSSAAAATAGNSQVGRLKFLDYLIKPVQRICKYPLLLDQLKVKRSEAAGGGSDELWEEDPVEGAASAMRRVVARVDRASERRAHAIKSNLIAARLLADCPASSPTSPVHVQVTVDDRRTQLSAEFMQSLGACMLAGALDVVYYQSNGSARAKYLASFLYVGGYLVLAKVPKGGKGYEAKHWFPLAGFEIVDQEDDEALPYAFHLCSPTAQIHFAASCQLEKTIWMTAIQESLTIMPSAWVNEPTINLPTDIRPLIFAAPEEALSSEWAATPLPTIQSMSELETPADSSGGPAPPTSSPRKIPKTIARAESLIIQQNHDLVKLSRRTSTTSVKAFFAPLTFDSRVTRPSGQIRQQVDNGLHDVLSDTFVAVRSQVLMRDEELFQLRKKPGNVSRSNSALSISGAFSTRRRRDSATIASRRKSSLDSPADYTNETDAATKAANLMLARRSKSSSGKLKRQRLSLLPTSAPPLPSKADTDENMPVVERSQSPSPLTRGPSAASSNTNSILPSPVELTMPLPTPGSLYSRSPDSRRAERPKRTRSMVDNVKYFFQSRSTSPTPSYQRSPRVSVVNLDVVEPETHGGLIQWWRRGSIRRRAQSSPDATTDDSTPVTPAASSDDSNHAELKAITDRDLLTASPTMLSADGRHRHVSFSQNRGTLARRRSLFASSTFASTTRLDQPSSLTTQNMPQLSRSKTLKNLFSFQRSPSQSGELHPQI